MKKQKIFGLLLVLVCFLGAIFVGGQPAIFLNFPSIEITFGGAFGAVLLYRAPDSTIDELIFQFGRFALWSGVLGTLIGNMQIAANLENPKMLGPAMSLSILTVFYGLAAYFVCNVIVGKKLKLVRGFKEDLLSVFLAVFSSGYVWAILGHALS